ncbi:MAG TPA: PH domain-containing protein [bacterium]|nr:PH domain-containing protein [bacterium]
MLCLDKLPNSEPKETVKLFLRRHWIDLLRIFLFSGAMLLVPVVIGVVLQLGDVQVLHHPLWSVVVMLALASYLLIVHALTLTEITDYWLDVWIVTSERVINTEQQGLFNRLVSEVHLGQIQDITSETKGLLETFLTYGDVYVQTAAEKERFRFKNVDNPDDVKITISQLVKQCKTTHDHDPKLISPGLGTVPINPDPTAKVSI